MYRDTTANRWTIKTLVYTTALTAILLGTTVNAQDADSDAQPHALLPSYASNALFVDEDGSPWAFAHGLSIQTVLGKSIIGGGFVYWETLGEQHAIAVLPTENPMEFWGIVSNGQFMLITVYPDDEAAGGFTITYQTGQGGAGTVYLF